MQIIFPSNEENQVDEAVISAASVCFKYWTSWLTAVVVFMCNFSEKLSKYLLMHHDDYFEINLTSNLVLCYGAFCCKLIVFYKNWKQVSVALEFVSMHKTIMLIMIRETGVNKYCFVPGNSQIWFRAQMLTTLIWDFPEFNLCRQENWDNITTHVHVIRLAAVIFARSRRAYFIGCTFILSETQDIHSFVRMVPSGFAVVCFYVWCLNLCVVWLISHKERDVSQEWSHRTKHF
jgi:hypothetical protein